MRKSLSLSCIFLFILIAQSYTPAVHAAAFTPGNLVIYRIGSGVGSLVNTGNPVFLDEYTPAGGLVQSIPMPTTASGGNFPLIANGTATSEGFITISSDMQKLILTGYGSTIPCSAACAGTAGTTIPRVVGVVDSAGTINTTTALTDFASGNNPRSAISTNGTDLWVTGGAGGARYTTLGSTTSTQLSTTPTNLRQLRIFNNQLYVSTASGSLRVATIGTGVPTGTGNTITNLPGFPTTGSPYGFLMVDFDAGVAGVDTMYVADDTALALTKYSLVGGNWTANGTIGIATDVYRGLAGVKTGVSTITLYAIRRAPSTATGGGELVSLTDSSGYNGAFSGTPTLLATAAANTVFRGVTHTPGTNPTAVALGQTQILPSSTPPILWVTAFVAILLMFTSGWVWQKRAQA